MSQDSQTRRLWWALSPLVKVQLLSLHHESSPMVGISGRDWGGEVGAASECPFPPGFCWGSKPNLSFGTGQSLPFLCLLGSGIDTSPAYLVSLFQSHTEHRLYRMLCAYPGHRAVFACCPVPLSQGWVPGDSWAVAFPSASSILTCSLVCSCFRSLWFQQPAPLAAWENHTCPLFFSTPAATRDPLLKREEPLRTTMLPLQTPNTTLGTWLLLMPCLIPQSLWVSSLSGKAGSDDLISVRSGALMHQTWVTCPHLCLSGVEHHE